MSERNKKLRGKKRRLKNLEFHIPKGPYCYGYRGDNKWVTCPFLKIDRKKSYQERGVCLAFNLRDSENMGLLWDMVKECGINKEYDKRLDNRGE